MKIENIHQALKMFEGSHKHAAFKYIYDVLSPKLYAIGLRYLENKDETLDILQETFIVIFNKMSDFKNKGSFEGWAKRIMVNNCLQILKKSKKINFISINNLEEYDDIQEVNEDIAELDFANLEEKLKIIPKNYQLILYMNAVDGLSHAEIAKYLGVTESTSRVLLYRAKNLIKSKIIKHEKA